MIPVIYSNLCPLCGGDLDFEEIAKAYCRKEKRRICEDEPLLVEFEEFFRKCIGEIRAIQKMWAKRILRNESFAATAPTGIGKTSFGLAMSLFLALKGWRCYVLLPTSLLVAQSAENIKKYAEKAGIALEDGFLGYYHGGISKKEKENFMQNLKNYKIVITTTQFLAKHHEELGLFNFIFVDDVDAILKASKNVERLLNLIGFYYDGKEWKGEAKGCLMVSTATAKKGKKAELFRKLLNFDIGSSRIAVRNVEDFAVNSEKVEVLVEILKKIGSGGIIYARNSEEAEKIYELLRKDFKIGIVTATKKADYEKFARGELDYLVGTAYYYGTLVRGLDLPERIRFTVFVGCPSFRVTVEDLEKLSPQMIRLLARIYGISEGSNAIKELKELMEREKPQVRDLVVRKGEVIFPDLRTYIQGSGRTSRLFAGGLTKGASFLLEEDAELLNAFIERAKLYDIEFKGLEEADFERLSMELDETRDKFRRRGEFDLIKPALFIVESPTKARQISRFFGKPSVKVLNGAVVYEVPMQKFVLMVTASIGHVVDLITNRGFHGVDVDGKFVPIYSAIKRCRDCGHQFMEERESCPKCNSTNVESSKRRIDALRKLASDAGFIIVGTDPDTEGEKIAWDLYNLLSSCGTVKRAEFHEITRRAVLQALESLRDINENLVKAQIVRRIEDRWIGFELSQKLWERFNNRNLSAGRAQTPVLGWIIERYKESRKKRTIAVLSEFDLVLEHDRDEFELEIKLIEEKEELKAPLPPYTTETLLSDANKILKLPVNKTMQIAQELFENGLITYHRTDSTRVSDAGKAIARDFLKDDFFGRDWGEEGAHECIRPTRPLSRDDVQRLIEEGVIFAEGLTWQHFALYDLIFRRFMASQCKPFKVLVRKFSIEFDGKSAVEERVVMAEGRAYELYKSVWVRKSLPIGNFRVKAELKRVPKVQPFTQAEIIQMMKERGIGRPSTYATIVERLFARNYVFENFGRIIPRSLGIEVHRFLAENYSKFVSEERTKDLESRMDAIERGELDYMKALNDLYYEIRSI